MARRPPLSLPLTTQPYRCPLFRAAGSRLTRRFALGLLLGLEILAGLLIDDLHRQPRLAALVEAEEFHLHLVAFLDDVGGLLHAARRQLADMNETVLGAEEVHEGAEIHDLDDGALIDVADFGLRGDRLDPVDRGLDRLAIGRRHLHGAVVLDVDLGAGLLDDLPDHLAAGADHFADLVGGDLESLDAGRVFAEFGARRVSAFAISPRICSRPSFAWLSATFMISSVMPAILMSICREVMPSSVPATLKSMSPR